MTYMHSPINSLALTMCSTAHSCSSRKDKSALIRPQHWSCYKMSSHTRFSVKDIPPDSFPMRLISGLRRKQFDAQFDVHFPTHNHIFRGDCPNVRGSVRIRILRSIRQVTSVSIGFKGEIHNSYRHVYVAYGIGGGITEANVVNDDCVLFNQVDSMNYRIPADLRPDETEMITKHFQFSFPPDKKLPSSCDKVGGTGDNQANTTVRYFLFATVSFNGTGLHPGGNSTYRFPIEYQGTDDRYARDRFKVVVAKQELRSRIKRMIHNAAVSRVSPVSSDSSSGGLGRGLRQLWVDSGRRNSTSPAETVPLQLQIFCQENFNLRKPLDELVRLRFEMPVNPGADAELAPWKYRLSKFSVRVVCRMTIHTGPFLFQTKVHQGLCSLQPQEEIVLDNAGFQLDENKKVWYREVSVAELRGVDPSAPLIDQLVFPVLCSYRLGSTLSVDAGLRFSLKLRDELADSAKEFRAETEDVVVSYYEPLPPYEA